MMTFWRRFLLVTLSAMALGTGLGCSDAAPEADSSDDEHSFESGMTFKSGDPVLGLRDTMSHVGGGDDAGGGTSAEPIQFPLTNRYEGEAAVRLHEDGEIREASVEATVYQDEADVRGVLNVSDPETDALLFGQVFEGEVTSDDMEIEMQFGERRCVNAEDWCDTDGDVAKPYETTAIYDGEQIVFDPLRVVEGDSRPVTLELFFGPSGGFKPAGAGTGGSGTGSPSGGVTLHTELEGRLTSASSPTTGVISGGEDCQMEFGERNGDVILANFACERTVGGSGADFVVDPTTFRYDDATGRFWFVADGSEEALILVGEAREESIDGAVAIESGKGGYWDPSAPPIAPMTLAFVDVVGGFHFDR